MASAVTETNEQKFSLGGVQCKKIYSPPGGNLIQSIVKVIYAGVEMSRKEGQKELSVICIEVVVQGTRGNEGTERSGVHDEEQWTKDRADE